MNTHCGKFGQFAYVVPLITLETAAEYTLTSMKSLQYFMAWDSSAVLFLLFALMDLYLFVIHFSYAHHVIKELF